ncbi:MAG: class I SAM-dependent methyltransferase [SAR324 cluster bacterium]|nr:class I SAM-dependent methyltransferase [SAR324 cluster bacterium]
MQVEVLFTTVLLNKYPIKYFKCPQCGYVQTEAPYWLEEAYNTSINDSDTGMIMRNLWLKNITSTLIYLVFDSHGKFLDYGGGYGIFVRLMRDVGFDFYWQDKHTENLFARGFEFSESENTNVELLTCFEAFEHFVDPLAELEKLLSISRNILLSTEIIPDPTPSPDDWWYYGKEHGQHIGFFQQKTFEFLASKYKLNFYTNGQNIHLLTEKKLLPSSFKLMTKVSKFITPFIQKRIESLTWIDNEKLKVPVS